MGVWVENTFRWLDDGRWQRSLRYLDDSLVTEVKLFHPELGLELVCHDLVDFHVDIYLKKILVHNLAGKRGRSAFFSARICVSAAMRWVTVPIMSRTSGCCFITRANAGFW